MTLVYESEPGLEDRMLRTAKEAVLAAAAAGVSKKAI